MPNSALKLKDLFSPSELQNFYDSVILGTRKYWSSFIAKEKPLELWFYKFSKDKARFLVIIKAMAQTVVGTVKPGMADLVVKVFLRKWFK